MVEYTREVSVVISKDTNKATTNVKLIPYENESTMEFLERVKEELDKIFLEEY